LRHDALMVDIPDSDPDYPGRETLESVTEQVSNYRQV
jgi:hypothetical protein